MVNDVVDLLYDCVIITHHNTVLVMSIWHAKKSMNISGINKDIAPKTFTLYWLNIFIWIYAIKNENDLLNNFLNNKCHKFRVFQCVRHIFGINWSFIFSQIFFNPHLVGRKLHTCSHQRILQFSIIQLTYFCKPKQNQAILSYSLLWWRASFWISFLLNLHFGAFFWLLEVQHWSQLMLYCVWQSRNHRVFLTPYELHLSHGSRSQLPWIACLGFIFDHSGFLIHFFYNVTNGWKRDFNNFCNFTITFPDFCRSICAVY